MNDEMKKVVDELNAATEDVIANAEKTKENKEDKLVPVLFKQISDTSIEILNSPEITVAFKLMEGEGISKKAISTLIQVIAISMSNAAYQSILFYDDLLKQELTRQFDNIGDHVNMTKADVEGIKAAIQVHTQKISDIDNVLILNKLKENCNKN